MEDKIQEYKNLIKEYAISKNIKLKILETRKISLSNSIEETNMNLSELLCKELLKLKYKNKQKSLPKDWGKNGKALRQLKKNGVFFNDQMGNNKIHKQYHNYYENETNESISQNTDNYKAKAKGDPHLEEIQ